jgi:hypothetical protein
MPRKLPEQPPREPDDLTMPSLLNQPAVRPDPASETHGPVPRPAAPAPWLLQQYYAGGIDLATELSSRYPLLPLMTVIRFRRSRAEAQPAVAALFSADSSASVHIEALPNSRLVQFVFTYSSMLTLRFQMESLSSMDCSHWLELIRRDQDGIAFLWGQSRWEKDYLITILMRQSACLYAFSRFGGEAGVRLTHDVKHRLRDWLAEIWSLAPADSASQLLTW